MIYHPKSTQGNFGPSRPGEVIREQGSPLLQASYAEAERIIRGLLPEVLPLTRITADDLICWLDSKEEWFREYVLETVIRLRGGVADNHGRGTEDAEEVLPSFGEDATTAQGETVPEFNNQGSAKTITSRASMIGAVEDFNVAQNDADGCPPGETALHQVDALPDSQEGGQS